MRKHLKHAQPYLVLYLLIILGLFSTLVVVDINTPTGFSFVTQGVTDTFNVTTIDSQGDAGQHNDLYAINSTMIYVSYQDTTNTNLIFANSSDRGTTWTNITVDSSSDTGYYTSLHVINESTIFIGYYDQGITKPVFANSSDFGKTWSNSTINDTAGTGQYVDIWAHNASLIFASYYDVEGGTAGRLAFANSSDGGKSWTNKIIEAGSAIGQHTSIEATNESTIFISYFEGDASDLKVANSSDGGVTWTTTAVDTTNTVGEYTHISAHNATTLFVSYYYQDNAAIKVANSSDGGKTWSTVTIADDDNTLGVHNDIYAVDQNVIYVTFDNDTGASASDILFTETLDGGATWKSTPVEIEGDQGDYNNIYALDNNTIFISYVNTTATDLMIGTQIITEAAPGADTTTPNVTTLLPAADSLFNESDSIEISANVPDNVNASTVIANVTILDGTVEQINLTNSTSDNETFNASYTIPTGFGYYNITFYANDTTGNLNQTETSNFTVNDVNTPNVTKLIPAVNTIFNQSDSIEISVNVTDNVNASFVYANITHPGGTVEQINLSNSTSDNETFNASYTVAAVNGNYNITFYANDTTGNTNFTETSNFTINSTGDTTTPNITGLLPTENSVYNVTVTIEISANVTDNVNASFVYANITYPDNTIEQINLTNDTINTNTYNASYKLPNATGTFNITYFGNDTSGNTNETESIIFNITSETTAPTINTLTITPKVQRNGSDILFNVTATDESGINISMVNISVPGMVGTILLNISPTYTSNYTVNATGIHNVTYIINDTYGNTATNTTTFNTTPEEKFNLTIISGNESSLNATISIYTSDTGELLVNETLLGNSSVTLPRTTIDIHLKSFNESIQVRLRNISANESGNKSIGLEYLSTPVSGYVISYAINSSYAFNNATVNISYNSSTYTTETDLQLEICSNWNFTNNTCIDTFVVDNTAVQYAEQDRFVAEVTNFSGFSIKENTPATSTSTTTSAPGGGGGSGNGGGSATPTTCTTGYALVNGTCKKIPRQEIKSLEKTPTPVETVCGNNICEKEETMLSCGHDCSPLATFAEADMCTTLPVFYYPVLVILGAMGLMYTVFGYYRRELMSKTWDFVFTGLFLGEVSMFGYAQLSCGTVPVVAYAVLGVIVMYFLLINVMIRTRTQIKEGESFTPSLDLFVHKKKTMNVKGKKQNVSRIKQRMHKHNQKLAKINERLQRKRK